VPELPEVEHVRRELDPVLRGQRITRVVLHRENLRRPFPAGFVARLEGATIDALTRRGKYLLAALSSGETLLVHLGMSGSFRVVLPAELRERASSSETLSDVRHDHVVIDLTSGARVVFNDPRRFGVMDLVEAGSPRNALALGPEPLDPAFDASVLARACAGRRTPIKALLLDQRVVAGLGNIYASEALHRARLSPRRPASTIATRSGLPRPAARRLAAAIKQALIAAIERVPGRRYRDSRFRVYDRAGEPCPRSGCHGKIRRIVQAGRSTFYCPVCQR
jgi:formamidopyrimidine-DNA glycosylase